MDMPYDIRFVHIKVDFQLPGNLTDDSVLFDTVQLPAKNHEFWMCLLMTYTELVVRENDSMHPNIEFTN